MRPSDLRPTDLRPTVFEFEGFRSSLVDSVTEIIDQIDNKEPYDFLFLVRKIQRRELTLEQIYDIVSLTSSEELLIYIIKSYQITSDLSTSLIDKIFTEDWYYALEFLMRERIPTESITDRYVRFLRVRQYPLNCFVILKSFLNLDLVRTILQTQRGLNVKKQMILGGL